MNVSILPLTYRTHTNPRWQLFVLIHCHSVASVSSKFFPKGNVNSILLLLFWNYITIIIFHKIFAGKIELAIEICCKWSKVIQKLCVKVFVSSYRVIFFRLTMLCHRFTYTIAEIHYCRKECCFFFLRRNFMSFQIK